jgi:multiple sugar transport system permease protein
MLLAGLQSMPDSLRRAAMLDGPCPLARFFAITLPCLKPNLLFISILTTINSLMAFDILWIMTRGGPGAATTVLSWLGYLTAFQFLRFGEGASLLYFLTALSFLLAIVYFVVFSPRRSVQRAPSAAVDEALPALLRARPRTSGSSGLARSLPSSARIARAALTRARQRGFALLAFVISCGPRFRCSRSSS